MKYLFFFLLTLVIFIISITLGLQNDQKFVFNYLVARGEYQISNLLATLFIFGFVIGWTICGLFLLKVKMSLVRAKRKIKRLERNIISISDIHNNNILSKRNS